MSPMHITGLKSTFERDTHHVGHVSKAKSTQRQAEREHFLAPPKGEEEVLPLLVQLSSSLSVYFVIGQGVLQRSRMLLLSRVSCGLQPLTHLVEGGCIDLTPCISLTEDI